MFLGKLRGYRFGRLWTTPSSNNELGPDYTPSRGSHHSDSSGYNALNSFSWERRRRRPRIQTRVAPQAFSGDDINASGFGGDGDIEGPPPSPVQAQRFPEDDLSDWEEEEWLGIGNQGSGGGTPPGAKGDEDGYRSPVHNTPVHAADIAVGKKRALSREPVTDRVYQRRRSFAGENAPSQSHLIPQGMDPNLAGNVQYGHASQNGQKSAAQHYGLQYPSQYVYPQPFLVYAPAPVYANNASYYYPHVQVPMSGPSYHNVQPPMPTSHKVQERLPPIPRPDIAGHPSSQNLPSTQFMLPPQFVPPPQFVVPPPAQNLDFCATYEAGSRSKLPFPKVSQARQPTADPVGLLTSVSHAVVDALRRGWSEVILLGHFSRRYSPLVSSHTPSLDSNSSITIGKGGQVSLKNKHLPGIPIESLTLNDWNEIKRNMPRAIWEHLIPAGEVLPVSEEALAAADMIENLFNIIDNKSRLGSEVVPLMMYADQKIRFWRARWEQEERCDIFDALVYRDIYEEWKRVEEEKKERERFSKSTKVSSFQSGSVQSGISHHNFSGMSSAKVTRLGAETAPVLSSVIMASKVSGSGKENAIVHSRS
ncbi:hypothetical protein F5880DRAFT_1511550 [Lentinula raphanica]|nr:hypothetical protein F5880DRAFT_1511550 [Lentinula raphanica]